jgi:hypothetical protein
MKKEFVPYYIAIQLKALGFNDECFSYYTHPDNLLDFILDGHDRVGTKKNSEFGSACSAPLWQQVFRWFRETHGYHGILDSCGELCEWKIASTHLEYAIRSGCIHAYDDAQLVCVEKLIELIREKNV